MTGAQKSYLHTLGDGADVATDDSLTKGEASTRIGELRHQAGEKHQSVDHSPVANLEKDPSTWVTGQEPMTGAQQSYLKTLSDEAGEEIDPSLNKAEASQKIDKLRQGNGRIQAASSHKPAYRKQS